jgi:hypothetical protein
MSKTAKDIGVCLGIILFAGLLYWDSLGLRKGTYDPLGPGTMPRIVAVTTIILCLIVIAQALWALRKTMPARLAEALEFEPRPWLALQIFGFMVVTAIAMNLRLPFGVTASLFMFFAIMAIRRYQLSRAPVAAILSILCGFGLTYVFGALFGVDLP